MAPKIEVSKVLFSREELSQGLVLLAGRPGQPWSSLIDVTRLTRFHHRSLQQSTPHPTLICKRRLHHEAAVQFDDCEKWAKIGTTRPLVQTDNKTFHIRTATWHLEKLSYWWIELACSVAINSRSGFSPLTPDLRRGCVTRRRSEHQWSVK